MAVGEAYEPLKRRLAEKGDAMVVGEGSDPEVEVGPVISGAARERILEWIDKGLAEGGELVLDGRGKGTEDGHFLGPTIIEAASRGGDRKRGDLRPGPHARAGE